MTLFLVLTSYCKTYRQSKIQFKHLFVKENYLYNSGLSNIDTNLGTIINLLLICNPQSLKGQD